MTRPTYQGHLCARRAGAAAWEPPLPSKVKGTRHGIREGRRTHPGNPYASGAAGVPRERHVRGDRLTAVVGRDLRASCEPVTTSQPNPPGTSTGVPGERGRTGDASETSTATASGRHRTLNPVTPPACRIALLTSSATTVSTSSSRRSPTPRADRASRATCRASPHLSPALLCDVPGIVAPLTTCLPPLLHDTHPVGSSSPSSGAAPVRRSWAAPTLSSRLVATAIDREHLVRAGDRRQPGQLTRKRAPQLQVAVAMHDEEEIQER